MNEPRAEVALPDRRSLQLVASDCLAGGGEMGALMRSFDWSKTKLGPVASWPQSLRTAVSIMLDSAFGMVVAWGPDFSFLYNDRYRPVLGATKHPGALGRPSKEIFPEVWHFIGPLFEKTRHGEAVALDDVLIPLDRNGYLEDCYFTLSYSPIRDESGGVGGMLAVVAETTDRVQGERRLATLRDLAALGEARGADDACAHAGRVLSANPTDVPFSLLYLLEPDGRHARLAGMSGLERDSNAAACVLDLDASDPWQLRDCCLTREPIVLTDLSARFGLLPGGAYAESTHAAVVLPMLRAGHDKPHGVLIAGVSPRRALDARYQTFFELGRDHVVAAIGSALAYEEARKRAEALAELDRAKTAFFTNVSHEFRTPLTLMLGPTEDALAAAEPALTGESLVTVHRNELRLLKLVNTLLDFSRIEAGRIHARYAPIDLAALTTDLASAFRSAIELGGLRYEVECPKLAEPIYVDAEMWEKIVLNLLSNAFKFTFDGVIRVALGIAGDHVELVVQDSGTGISQAELPHLFERFHRIEGARSRTHEGSGIGLALVHDLVKLHGGTIAVSSELGGGTTFTVSIPIGSGHLPVEQLGTAGELASTALGAEPYLAEAMRWLTEPGAQSLLPPPSAVMASATKEADAKRVLVVDDNSDMREYLSRLLSPRWTVLTAADGVQALALAREHRPDLVLSDVMMPNLDGIGLLRELRADPRTANVPVIMLSARAGEESRIEGLRASADDYLTKPFSARELVARVSTQLQLAAYRRAAEHERTNLVRLFTGAPVAIAMLEGPEHRCILANPKYQELAGHRDMTGRPLLEAMPELRGQPLISILDRVFATGEPFAMSELAVQIVRDERLQDAWFNVSWQPMRELEAQVTGVLVCAVEVTDHVLARNELEAARAQAEAANRTKDEFLAMLGHELRNPLAPIMTALHLMRLRGVDKAEKERAVIERQAHHLVRLVDDLLDVSRITQGKIEIKKQRIEMAEIVARAIEMASPLIEQRQHHLDVEVPSKGLIVDADPARLAQVLSNLLANAAKYTERGGHVALCAAQVGHDIVVHVRDTGIGIPPETLPLIFDMFVQEPQALDRSQGGLGLGLTIVRSIVGLHGGSVEARSDGRNMGSEFVVRFPAGAAELATGHALDAASATSGMLRAGHRILIVDDNEDAAEILAMSLVAMGHTARVTHDGPSALKILDELRPEVALVDIGLPVMDGYELARRLRSHSGLVDLKLVALTGYGRETDRQLSHAAGFDVHLVKPIGARDLELVIKALLAGGAADVEPA